MARASDPVRAREVAAAIVKTLRGAGHVAYFAGGCVRDELLGLRPTDFDVATDATPPRVRELFPRTAEVGAAFGVILVQMQGCSVEVATFRSDGPYTDARRPDRIHFSDPESDARRRDFTINALFLDPVASADSPDIRGHVVDYVGGMADLKAKVIRAVGDPDQRLAEDHLRALRAVRFMARLGFRLDDSTAAAIKRHATQLRGVSRERIGDELRRMLLHPTRAGALSMLQSLGLDAPVLDEPASAAALVCVKALSGEIGVMGARGGQGGGEGGVKVACALAAWAVDRFGPRVDQVVVTGWRRALNLSNEESDQLGAILRGLPGLIEHGHSGWLAQGVARQKRLASQGWFADALAVAAGLDSTTANRIRNRVSELEATPGGLHPEPLINGDDLVRFGMRPGPRFKAVLDGVYDAQLEGRVLDRAAAMELAKQLGV